MPRELIVNADDFGLSRPVNEGIVRAHSEGIVTSTTVLATGDEFEHAVSLAHRYPTLDIGVHLALVGQRPLLDPAEVPTLVREDGLFHESIFVFARRYATGRIDLADVERELDAQVARVRTALPVSHVDSHQHAHALPGIARVVQRLCFRHSIGAMRWPIEALRTRHLRRPQDALRFAQLGALNVCGLLIGRTELWRPGAFAGFMTGGRLDEQALLGILRTLPDDAVTELMCHPGTTPPREHFPQWGYHWNAELQALTSLSVRRYLEESGIRLTSYRERAA